MSEHADNVLHLGYSATELATSLYARFFKSDMAPLPAHVREAIAVGLQTVDLLPPIEGAPDLHAKGYWPVETGITISSDGAFRIFVLTQMPGVTPAMWDWWFAWHGSEAQRYKLWHPRAHMHAAWADGRDDLTHYVGRTSHVVEYVGNQRLNLGIRFVTPTSLGLDEARLARDGEVAICARGSMAGTPMETGWLIHHVRPVLGGAEMRSRFWLAGSNIRPRGMPGPVGSLIGQVAAKFAPLTVNMGMELLVHCAQEMNHLAGILPDLYAAFGPESNRFKGEFVSF
jgi:hypothetical protein